MRKPELLAPAGSMDALKAAIAGGCDAIYLGLTNFSARAFAGNFTHEEFTEAIRYAHERGVRIYVTMNTMLYETEIENAKKEIDFLYHADCDALLIQDYGLFHYVRTCYPDFEIHCSTQMHIHNLSGVRFMQQQGAARVVLARESPIELIREAVNTGMEIEVFAYGAICISYSGQCLMSASLKNRSANRGMCAQCCRLKYYDREGDPFEEGEYLLSPKDLNVIDRLPQLMEAGVSSLKIEGRMKRPEYVYLTVKTFREAIDTVYAGRSYTLSRQRQKELLLMFNRGFSHGHLFHDDVKQRMSWFRPNHMGVRIGTVVRYYKGRVLVRLTDTLNQNDGLRILDQKTDIGLTAVKIEKNGRLVNRAQAKDEVWLECHGDNRPVPGAKLQKTSDRVLIDAIDRAIAKGKDIPVSVNCTAFIGSPFEVRVKDEDGFEAMACSTFLVERAKNAPLSKEKIENALSKSGDLPFNVTSVSMDTDEVFMPVSVMNDTRRNAMEKLCQIRAVRHPERTEAKEYQFSLSQPKEPEKHILLLSDHMDPDFSYPDSEMIIQRDPIVPAQDAKERIDHEVISQAGDLAMDLSDCIAGMNLNIANSYAAAFVLSIKGINSIIVSSEMNNMQIHDLYEAFEKRYGFRPFLYRLVYGRRTLMYIKDRFTKDADVSEIRDYHGNLFKVNYNGLRTEILEHRLYVSENPYCDGSAVIPDGPSETYKEILEEAYEELYERIQEVRT